MWRMKGKRNGNHEPLGSINEANNGDDDQSGYIDPDELANGLVMVRER